MKGIKVYALVFRVFSFLVFPTKTLYNFLSSPVRVISYKISACNIRY
jgi:hypothetical protein